MFVGARYPATGYQIWDQGLIYLRRCHVITREESQGRNGFPGMDMSYARNAENRSPVQLVYNKTITYPVEVITPIHLYMKGYSCTLKKRSVFVLIFLLVDFYVLPGPSSLHPNRSSNKRHKHSPTGDNFLSKEGHLPCCSCNPASQRAMQYIINYSHTA